MIKSISVLGQVYKIKRVKGLAESHNAAGLCDPQAFLISLDYSLKGKYLERVLFHELAHAFAYESGLYEFTQSQSLEMFCQSFSGFLAEVKKNL